MPLVAGISRDQLRDAVVAGLAAAGTLAGVRVFGNRFMPLQASQYPVILVATPLEVKELLSAVTQGAPKFRTVVTLAIVLRTASPTPAPSAPSRPQADAELQTLVNQVEQALLCTEILLSRIEAITSVALQYTVTGEGKPVLGEATMIFACQVFQAYGPDGAVPLLAIEGHHTDVAADPDAPQAPPTDLFARWQALFPDPSAL